MNFDWGGLTEEIWNEYCAAQGNREENNDYLGCCRVGDLSFDILTCSIESNTLEMVLRFDLYVGGIDTTAMKILRRWQKRKHLDYSKHF